MKKFILFATCALLAFSSFTTSEKRWKAPAGASFSAHDSYTWTDIYGTTCTDELIYFSALTVEYDYHGVDNGKVYMIQGRDRFYGTGTSISTGETFVADFETRFNEKSPMINGAIVIKSRTRNSFISQSGRVDAFRFSSRLTFSAKGKLAIDRSRIEVVCD